MLLALQNYDLIVEYTRGKDVVIADTLSRAFPVLNNKSQSEHYDETLAKVEQFAEEEIIASKFVRDLIKSAARDDEIYTALKAQITRGWPTKQKSVPEPLRQFFSYREELTIDGDLIFKGARLFAPTRARQALVERAHMSHIGINSCIRRAKDDVFWPGMASPISLRVAACGSVLVFTQTCSRSRSFLTPFRPDRGRKSELIE